MDLFHLHDNNRSVPSAPGARKAVVSAADAASTVREVLVHLAEEGLTAALFPLVAPDGQADDDPDLGPVLGLCGPRLLTAGGVAILPPARRFNRERTDQVYRMYAVGRWINGVNGFALAPSDWRPELSVWAYSEGGLQREGEWGPVADWLVELVAPLKRYTAGTDPDERTQLLASWSERADELWETIEGDLGSPQPRPDWRRPAGRSTPQRPWAWSGEVTAGRAEGVWTFSHRGVVRREEAYFHGRRHGPATRWHIAEEPRPGRAPGDFDDDPFVYRQGHVEREGMYVDGAAQGVFRFFDEWGRLLQVGAYEHGWPHGRWTVHPAATRGIAQPASVDYDCGVPVSWSIPTAAFDSVQLTREGGEPATLAGLARGSRGVVLVNWTGESVRDLPGHAAQELAGLPGVLILGVHPDTPGSGHLGGRAVDIVADPTGGLTRAYEVVPGKLHGLTYLDAEGGFRGSSATRHARFRDFLADNEN